MSVLCVVVRNTLSSRVEVKYQLVSLMTITMIYSVNHVSTVPAWPVRQKINHYVRC